MLRRFYGLGLVAAVAILTAAVTIPIVILLILSLKTEISVRQRGFTFLNFSTVLHDPATWHSVENTLIYTVGSAFGAVLLGALMAWAVQTVNVPFRSLLRVLPICVLLLPPLVKDPAWIIVFSKGNGLFELFLHSNFGIHSPFNVYTMYGMISVTAIFGAPFAYAIMLQPFGSIDRSMVEASAVSGARLGTTLRRVLIPMVRPAIISAITFQVITIAGGFETPILIGTPAGIPTFMGQIYSLVSSPVRGLNIAAAQASVYLVLTFAMVTCYLLATRNERRFVSISGRGHNPVRIEAPILRWVLAVGMLIYAFLGFLGPLIITVLTSFLPFYSATKGNPFHDFTFSNYSGVFDDPQVVTAIKTSTFIAVVTAIGVVVVGGLLSYLTLKTKSRIRRVGEFIGMLPIAIPGLVYSVGLLFTVLSVPGLAPIAYGTKGLMIIGEILVFVPLAMRLMSSAMIQMQDELLEASRMGGASATRTMRAIVLPLLRPAIIYTLCVVFVMSYRELGAVVLLVAQNTVVVPFVSLTFWVTGGFTQLAALNVITLIAPLAVVLLLTWADRISSRGPARPRVAALPVPAADAVITAAPTTPAVAMEKELA
jgi:iron(III) transport system permease protein